MAAIDYFAIEEAVQTTLAGYNGLKTSDGVKVLVEEDFLHVAGGMDNGKVVIVYLDDRAATPGQPLAAGQRTRFAVGFSIWVFAVSAESFKKAAELRDDLVGLVEVALMTNRTLSNGVAFLYLGGGEFMSARRPSNGAFLAAAEVKMVCEAVATT